MTVGTWFDDQLAVDHVHPAGEAEVTCPVRQKLDRRLPVGGERPVQSKVRKDHAGGALATFLAVEDDSQRNTLANSHQVGRVATFHGYPDFLNVADLRRRMRLLGTEEEPTQEPRQRQSNSGDSDVRRIHWRSLTGPLRVAQ